MFSSLGYCFCKMIKLLLKVKIDSTEIYGLCEIAKSNCISIFFNILTMYNEIYFQHLSICYVWNHHFQPNSQPFQTAVHQGMFPPLFSTWRIFNNYLFVHPMDMVLNYCLLFLQFCLIMLVAHTLYTSPSCITQKH